MAKKSGGNDGVLFINENKERGDKRPNFTGSIEVDGTKYSLAAWKNISANDVKYISLKLSEWREKGDEKKDEAKPEQKDDFDDDIPF